MLQELHLVRLQQIADRIAQQAAVQCGQARNAGETVQLTDIAAASLGVAGLDSGVHRSSEMVQTCKCDLLWPVREAKFSRGMFQGGKVGHPLPGHPPQQPKCTRPAGSWFQMR